MVTINDCRKNGYGTVQVLTQNGTLSILDFNLEGIKAVLSPYAQRINQFYELFQNFNQCLDPEVIYININSRAHLVEAFLGDDSKIKHDHDLYKHTRQQLAKLSKKPDINYFDLFNDLTNQLFQ